MDPAEYGYEADHENEGTKGEWRTNGNGVGHEARGLAYGGDETYERERPKPGNEEAYEHGELEDPAHYTRITRNPHP